jgi:Down syndrome cell adhesion protein
LHFLDFFDQLKQVLQVHKPFKVFNNLLFFCQFQIIQEKPETPYGLKVIDKKGRMVKLSWQAPYNGNSNLTRYVIEFKPSKGSWRKDIDHVLVPGDQTMAAVFSLKPATSYHFR